MNKLREIGKKVSEKSEYVRIDESGIEKFCNSFDIGKMKHWLAHAPYNIRKLDIENRLAYLFTFNSISFSYWGEPKWTISYDKKEIDGAWAMLACLGRKIQETPDFIKSDYLSHLSLTEFKEILFGNVEIPLIKERLDNLNEIGQVITAKYGGKFRYLIEESEYDADNLFDIIISDFPSFQDVSKYDADQIEFYKRARLLVSDIVHNCHGKNGFRMNNLENLTACADYKLPQVMRRYGILKYSDELSSIINSKTEILSGNMMEIEIRANTIHAVELVKEQLNKKISNITSMDINDYLWLEGQIKLPMDLPYHRTRTTAY